MDQRGLQVGAGRQVVEGGVQGEQGAAGVRFERDRYAAGRGIAQRRRDRVAATRGFHRHAQHGGGVRPVHSGGDGGGEGGASRSADGMRVRQRRIRHRRGGRARRACGPDANGGNAHQRPVASAVWVRPSVKGCAGGRPTTERVRFEPPAVVCARGVRIVLCAADQTAGQREGQFGVVGRLTREGAIRSAVEHVAQAGRVAPGDGVFGLPFHERSEAIAGGQAQQASHRAVDGCFRRHAGPGQGYAGLAAGFGASAPWPGAQCLHHQGCPPKAGGRPALPLVVIGDGNPVLRRQHAPSGQQQRMAGRDVVGIHGSERHRRQTVPNGDPRQAVGNGGQGHETAGRHGGAVPDRALPNPVVQEHHVGGGQLPPAQVDRHQGAIAGDTGCALRPGDHVRAPVGAERGINHAEHGDAAPQQGDGHGAAAAALKKRAGAIVRIDHPAVAIRCVRRLGREYPGFLPHESGGEQGDEAVAEVHLHLVIHRRGHVVAEAGAIGAHELGGQHVPGLAGGVDYRWQQRGWDRWHVRSFCCGPI